MKRDLQQYEGTIANYLTNHKNEIWACGNNIVKMKQVVLDLLSKDEIKNNPQTPKAIKVLSKLNGARFTSTLMTYMTGMKVGM